MVLARKAMTFSRDLAGGHGDGPVHRPMPLLWAEQPAVINS